MGINVTISGNRIIANRYVNLRNSLANDTPTLFNHDTSVVGTGILFLSSAYATRSASQPLNGAAIRLAAKVNVKNMNTLAATAKINQSSPRASCAHKLSTVGSNQSSSASNWSIKSHASPANTRTFTNSGIRKKRRNPGRKMRR